MKQVDAHSALELSESEQYIVGLLESGGSMSYERIRLNHHEHYLVTSLVRDLLILQGKGVIAYSSDETDSYSVIRRSATNEVVDE